jgi:hypothetical protein
LVIISWISGTILIDAILHCASSARWNSTGCRSESLNSGETEFAVGTFPRRTTYSAEKILCNFDLRAKNFDLRAKNNFSEISIFFSQRISFVNPIRTFFDTGLNGKLE